MDLGSWNPSGANVWVPASLRSIGRAEDEKLPVVFRSTVALCRIDAGWLCFKMWAGKGEQAGLSKKQLSLQGIRARLRGLRPGRCGGPSPRKNPYANPGVKLPKTGVL